ncbi:MAG: 50S ribosomal protein L12 [Nanoarchaeota archaeon]|nr:50S ribosomal protein L12 [Nanoarchaeota archaeon]
MEYIYGALLLHKLGQPVNEESLKKVIEATGSQIDEAKLKVVVTSLKNIDIEKELESASLVVPAGSAASGEEKAEAKEEKKEEKAEAAAEGLSALFG